MILFQASCVRQRRYPYAKAQHVDASINTTMHGDLSNVPFVDSNQEREAQLEASIGQGDCEPKSSSTSTFLLVGTL